MQQACGVGETVSWWQGRAELVSFVGAIGKRARCLCGRRAFDLEKGTPGKKANSVMADVEQSQVNPHALAAHCAVTRRVDSARVNAPPCRVTGGMVGRLPG